MPDTGVVSSGLIASLTGILGDRVTTAMAVRETHGRDESWHAPHPPDAVAFPESVDEVVAIVTACAAHKTPMIPFGVGTSLEGHADAERDHRRLHRHEPHGPRAAGERGGPRLPRRARRHAQATQ
jgi:FAD/FMN-containing dehydrogenase